MYQIRACHRPVVTCPSVTLAPLPAVEMTRQPWVRGNGGTSASRGAPYWAPRRGMQRLDRASKQITKCGWPLFILTQLTPAPRSKAPNFSQGDLERAGPPPSHQSCHSPGSRSPSLAGRWRGRGTNPTERTCVHSKDSQEMTRGGGGDALGTWDQEQGSRGVAERMEDRRKRSKSPSPGRGGAGDERGGAWRAGPGFRGSGGAWGWAGPL